jgi:twitching motility protein PilI
MAVAHENPFLWLQELEQLARQRGKGLPRQEKIQQIWRGIAFRVGKFKLVTSLTEIREVLYCPKIMAKVPGGKPWVKGIANIRGQLLPVIDIQACLGGRVTLVENRTRLLIINQVGTSSGILVDEVLGIKHFQENERDSEAVFKDEWFAPYARGAFTQEGDTWIVFDTHALSKSRAFLDAAL